MADDFLTGLNFISPPTSVEASPANGTADPARRTAWDLSAPVDAGQVAASLDAWTNVSFDFESIVGAGGTPPAFDRAFAARSTEASALPLSAGGDVDGAAAFLLGGAGLDPSALSIAPSTLALPPAPVPELDSAVTPAPTPTTGRAARRSLQLGGHVTGVGTDLVSPSDPSPAYDDESANRKAVEEDKRRRNTAASARFRVKKKQREQALEQSERELRERVVTLEKEVDTLKSENGWLRKLVLDRSGPLGAAPPAAASDAAAVETSSSSKRTRSG